MTKYDLLETGTRLIGVWFVVSGITALLSVTISMLELGSGPPASVLLIPIVQSFGGTCILFLAPSFVRWMRRTDTQAVRTPDTVAPPAPESL